MNAIGIWIFKGVVHGDGICLYFLPEEFVCKIIKTCVDLSGGTGTGEEENERSKYKKKDDSRYFFAHRFPSNVLSIFMR